MNISRGLRGPRGDAEQCWSRASPEVLPTFKDWGSHRRTMHVEREDGVAQARHLLNCQKDGVSSRGGSSGRLHTTACLQHCHFNRVAERSCGTYCIPMIFPIHRYGVEVREWDSGSHASCSTHLCLSKLRTTLVIGVKGGRLLLPKCQARDPRSRTL